MYVTATCKTIGQNFFTTYTAVIILTSVLRSDIENGGLGAGNGPSLESKNRGRLIEGSGIETLIETEPRVCNRNEALPQYRSPYMYACRFDEFTKFTCKRY